MKRYHSNFQRKSDETALLQSDGHIINILNGSFSSTL